MIFRLPITALLLLAPQVPASATLEGIVMKNGTAEPVPRASVVVLDSGFELNSESTDTLESLLAPNAATITATVVDENQKAVQGATVAIVSDLARRPRQDLNKS